MSSTPSLSGIPSDPLELITKYAGPGSAGALAGTSTQLRSTVNQVESVQLQVLGQSKQELMAWVGPRRVMISPAQWQAAGLNSEHCDIESLLTMRALINTNRDTELNAFFDWLANLNPSPLDARDPGSAFRNSLAALTPAAKALRVRAWLAEHAPFLQVLPADLTSWIFGPDETPPEFLHIPNIRGNADLLSKAFEFSLGSGRSFEFPDRVIHSIFFRLIQPKHLGWAFQKACQTGNKSILQALMKSDRFEELYNRFQEVANGVAGVMQNHPETTGKWLINRLPIRLMIRATFDFRYAPNVHDRIIQVVSKERLQYLFAYLSENVDNPHDRVIFHAMLNAPRASEIDTSTLVKGLLVSAGAKTVVKTAAVATYVCLAVSGCRDLTGDDFLQGPPKMLAAAAVASITNAPKIVSSTATDLYRDVSFLYSHPKWWVKQRTAKAAAVGRIGKTLLGRVCESAKDFIRGFTGDFGSAAHI